ncbi:MAG: hypothetical protein KKH94_09335 [Candidatus Omnitrophica bacterium]|nr:hypothetical protein [Candidatus Omnitrophota bacterium]
MRNAAVSTIEKLCRKNKDIFVLTGDLGFRLFDSIRSRIGRRFINMGIAETNMIGVASGMALSGKMVFCYSIIPFLIMRCFEHIRVDICNHNVNVRLMGVGAGLVYGLEGLTHHATEDVALMRTLPNMTIVAPGDPYESESSIKASIKHNGPLYIRLGKAGEPAVHKASPRFDIGKGIVVIEKGTDVCMIASGTLLYNAKVAAEKLIDRGIGVRLISMHTIKPIDKQLIVKCSKKFGSIVTIEEHSIIGGLGDAVGDVLLEKQYTGVFRKIGLPDAFNQYVGRNQYLLQQYNLDSAGIETTVINLVHGKRKSRTVKRG